MGTNVAVQDHRSKLWDTYGVVTAIGSQRQYYVKSRKGSVLVRNRRFIRCRVPESVPYLPDNMVKQNRGPEAMNQHTAKTRRSSRQKKPTQSLIEDPNWNYVVANTVN